MKIEDTILALLSEDKTDKTAAIISPDFYLHTETGEYVWTVDRAKMAWRKSMARLARFIESGRFKKLVLLIGLPASGKSSWLQRNHEKTALYFDATFTIAEFRAPVIQAGLKAGMEVWAVVMDTPIEVCLDRNSCRSPDRKIPEDAITRMQAQLLGSPPQSSEGFSRIIHVRATGSKQAAPYAGNLGAIEMLQFYQKATPSQVKLMEELLDRDRFQQALDLLRKVTGVNLHDFHKAAATVPVPPGWTKAPQTGHYIVWVSPQGNVKVQDTLMKGSQARFQVLYLPKKETMVQDGKLVNRHVAPGQWLEVDDMSSLTAAFALGVKTEKHLQTAKTGVRLAHSNAKLVEVPSSFHAVEVLPPQAKREEYPFQGFIDFQGIKIDVENVKGSTRSGKGPEGDWSTYMHAHYGEIRGTEGTDGDKLDVYVGDNHDSSLVVVIHQHNPWDGKYDEDKVVIGCDFVEEAIGLYKKQYDRPGFFRDGEYTAMPIGAFWRWVHEEKNRGKKVKMAGTMTLFLTPSDQRGLDSMLGFNHDDSQLKREERVVRAVIRRVDNTGMVTVTPSEARILAEWKAAGAQEWGGSEDFEPDPRVVAKYLKEWQQKKASSVQATMKTSAAFRKVTIGEATARLKADHWHQDWSNQSYMIRTASFYSTNIKQSMHTGTKKTWFEVSWYTGNPARRWGTEFKDTLHEAVALLNAKKAESDRITAEELGQSPEGQL